MKVKPSRNSDNELVRIAREGGEGCRAEGELLESLEPLILSVARVKAPPPFRWPWEDTLQDLRLALLHSIRTWDSDGGTSLATYARKLLCWECEHIWRKTKPKGYTRSEIDEIPTTISIEVLVLQHYSNQNGENTATLKGVVASDLDTEAEVISDCYCEWAQSKIFSLQTKDKRVISILNFRLIEGLSQAEVSKILAISQMHVSRLEKQGIRLLKNAILEAK